MERLRAYLDQLHTTLDRIHLAAIDELVAILLDARLRDRQVFAMGNGGSSATASHFVADLGKNTRVSGWPHFRVVGLVDNVAAITAYANDEGYENVFSEQLAGLVRKGDVVMGISCSGNSPNVLKAIELANNAGATTVGLTGFDGGRLAGMVALNIHVPSQRIEQVEDIHMMIEHMVITAMREATQHQTFAGQMAALFTAGAGLGRPSPGDVAAGKNGHAAHDPLVLINRITRELIDAAPEYFDRLQRILQLTVDSVEASSGSILLLDAEGQVTDGLLAYGGKVRTGITPQLIEVFKQGLAGWVVREKTAALVLNTRDDPRWLPRSWDIQETSRSAISVPVIDEERVICVLTLTRNQMGGFTEDDLSLLSTIAMFLTFQLSQKRP